MNLTAAKPFETAATNDNKESSVSPQSQQKKFNHHYDILISETWFSTEAESILPENVEKTKIAFQKFLKNMGWPRAEHSFEKLLKEKTGEFEFRADGNVPNWYHEFRECLHDLNFIRNKILIASKIEPYGGAEASISIRLRHDSWEDLGISPEEILDGLNKIESGSKLKSEIIAQGVDKLTRKIPVRDESGEFVRKPNGKILKKDRYNGQVNLYYNEAMSHPLTATAKYSDGVEGMSTRVGVLDFSVEDDKKYAAERRALYGNRNLDEEVISKFPFLKDAITALDHMLGITLVALETLNFYAPEDKQDPTYAPPMRIKKYHKAAKAFEGIPPCHHPVNIMMERMWAKANRENDLRVEKIITNAYLPELEVMFPNITIYSMRGSSPALPKDATYAPNMQ